MRELTCKACGRTLNSGLTFCPFCGSKDIVSNTFNNVNNAYRRQASPNPSSSYVAYNKNYSNNMYGNHNSIQSNTGYNSTSDDFDKRMNQMQQNILNKSMGQSGNQNKRVSFANNFSNNKYGNDSYTQYDGSNYNAPKNESNPYVTNKNYYTHNNSGFQSKQTFSQRYSPDDIDEESSGLSNLHKGIISFVAVLVVGMVILFCTGTFDSVVEKAKATFKGNKTEMADNSDKSDKSNVLTGSAETPIDKGELVDNVYTNKWSNVKITIPEGYVNKDEEAYKQYTTEFMACGLYVENAEGESIVNLYIDLKNDDGTFTEEAYLEENKANFASYGMEITNATSNDKIQICGKEYTCIHLTAKSGSITLSQSIYVRKDGNKAGVFMITSKGDSTDNNKAIVEAFQSYEG